MCVFFSCFVSFFGMFVVFFVMFFVFNLYKDIHIFLEIAYPFLSWCLAILFCFLIVVPETGLCTAVSLNVTSRVWFLFLVSATRVNHSSMCNPDISTFAALGRAARYDYRFGCRLHAPTAPQATPCGFSHCFCRSCVCRCAGLLWTVQRWFEEQSLRHPVRPGGAST